MWNGAIVGHSFVSSASDHLRSPSPAATAKLLNISEKCSTLYMIGERGACILDDTFHLPYDLLNLRPDFVVLEYGSNDLACGAATDCVSERVVALANSVVNMGIARLVMVCGVLPRIGRLSLPSGVVFDNIVTDYNHRLHALCESERNIIYKSHNGFWSPAVHTWSRDGIHPNSQN